MIDAEKKKERDRRYRAKHSRNEYFQERYLENSDLFKLRSILRKYKLTEEEYNKKINSQNGCCAICHKVMNPPNVDHDHSCCPHARKTCGKCTRDLLCKNCNTALGLFCENEEILTSAIQYIKKHKR